MRDISWFQTAYKLGCQCSDHLYCSHLEYTEWKSWQFCKSYLLFYWIKWTIILNSNNLIFEMVPAPSPHELSWQHCIASLIAKPPLHLPVNRLSSKIHPKRLHRFHFSCHRFIYSNCIFVIAPITAYCWPFTNWWYCYATICIIPFSIIINLHTILPFKEIIEVLLPESW